MSDSYYQLIADRFEIMHKELENKYKTRSKQKESKAQELENFFNYIVYGSRSGSYEYINMNSILTKEIADSILAVNPDLGHQLRNKMKGASSYAIGQAGEQGFADLILATLEYFVNENNTSGNKIDLGSINIQSGQDYVTVLKGILNDKEIQEFNKMVASKIEGESHKSLDKIYGKFQQKTDISGVKGLITLRPELAWLLELSATVKNYSDEQVGLGKTSNIKILRATISASSALSQKEKELLYSALNNMSKGIMINKFEEKGAKHFRHIQSVYELMGIGQMASDNVAQAAELPNYLMVNIRKSGKERIIIKSVPRLAYEILREQDGISSANSRGVHLKFSK